MANTVKLNKTAVNKLLVAERKSMREKAKHSAFMRKTLNIYNGMAKRAAEYNEVLEFGVAAIREILSDTTCNYCGCDLTIKRMTVDHERPIARGGTFLLSNLRAACCSCNWQKGMLTADEFGCLMCAIQDFHPSAQADIKRRLTMGGKWSFGK